MNASMILVIVATALVLLKLLVVGVWLVATRDVRRGLREKAALLGRPLTVEEKRAYQRPIPTARVK